MTQSLRDRLEAHIYDSDPLESADVVQALAEVEALERVAKVARRDQNPTEAVARELAMLDALRAKRTP
jgi:hypothetical protein